MSRSATLADWVEGARLRTLPAAISPVAAGTGLAIFHDAFDPLLALLCLLLALSLQVGVNYANDYSDGIRGTDAERVGPLRLVGSGLVEPRRVKFAAFGCFALGALTGLVITAVTGWWWLLIIGAFSILAAWYYTGGSRPYGYSGLGEVFVFVFFGLVATSGTALVQTGFGAAVIGQCLLASTAIGLLACAILMANNIRDIAGDAEAGKHTLAVRLGERRARLGYLIMVVIAALCCVWLAGSTTWWALLSLIFCVVVAPGTRRLLRGAGGRELIGVLKATGIAELVCALGLLAGLLLGSL
ncbi:1,4-dihydroxy-2-naphthoate polyprenyltransferase [Naumannella halotolerans]|uniref:1,4-dihydroxy-2-naphthoate octaprenyltransferase n=1 Tax=Naumannella halotolerans TaxID=993414 RepID=A0A4R7JAP7_9ACTN|nr:1,4-dihydroxy-2-naphthoate polyprenyltransferase [Naumannella halotolerans]TDT34465.1 1,4-dihydroxy-2-naphthoate octaprenyltransferase [Naumannella halotolerans]